MSRGPLHAALVQLDARTQEIQMLNAKERQAIPTIANDEPGVPLTRAQELLESLGQWHATKAGSHIGAQPGDEATLRTWAATVGLDVTTEIIDGAGGSYINVTAHFVGTTLAGGYVTLINCRAVERMSEAA